MSSESAEKDGGHRIYWFTISDDRSSTAAEQNHICWDIFWQWLIKFKYGNYIDQRMNSFWHFIPFPKIHFLPNQIRIFVRLCFGANFCYVSCYRGQRFNWVLDWERDLCTLKSYKINQKIKSCIWKHATHIRSFFGRVSVSIFLLSFHPRDHFRGCNPLLNVSQDILI